MDRLKRFFITSFVFSALFVISGEVSGAYSPTYVPRYTTIHHTEHTTTEKNNYYYTYKNDLPTMINIANVIGIDRVYNHNYDGKVNEEIKIFYEVMSRAEKEIENKDEIKSFNQEYVERIASIISQSVVNDDMIFYLRYSYSHKLAIKYPKMVSIANEVDREKIYRNKETNKEVNKEEKQHDKSKKKEKNEDLIFIIIAGFIIIFTVCIFICIACKF